MAVKKVTKKEEVKETPITVEEEAVNNEAVDVEVEDTAVAQEDEEDSVPEVEISTEEPKEEPEVEVDTGAVKDETVTSKNVRIRVARDHRCFIGGELYDLKEGMCYNVPEFVKSVLNRAGILSPL